MSLQYRNQAKRGGVVVRKAQRGENVIHRAENKLYHVDRRCEENIQGVLSKGGRNHLKNIVWREGDSTQNKLKSGGHLHLMEAKKV